MHALILAGGFAKRLWPLTKDKPKPLLPIAGKPIIEHIIKKIGVIENIDKIFISTNDKFDKTFKEWIEKFDSKKEIELIIEPTHAEKEKLGSIGAIKFFLERERVSDALLIVAGDNLFEFNLLDFFDFYKKKKAPVIGLHDIRDIKQAKKLGIAEIDKSDRIIGFEEKPEKPKSTLSATLIYILPKKVLELIPTYLENSNNPDAPGYFISWLYKKHPVYGFVFSEKWYDIGSFEALEKAEKEYKG